LTVTLISFAAGPADAQTALKKRTPASGEQRDKKEAPQAEVTAAPGTPAPDEAADDAAECLPNGQTAEPVVNTLEDILVMTGFGLSELEGKAVAEEPRTAVEWRAVEPEAPRR
jgi:hypothetical protein